MDWLIVYALIGILFAEVIAFGNRKLKTKNVEHKKPGGYLVLVLFWPIILISALIGKS